jgi:hypothetical protein
MREGREDQEDHRTRRGRKELEIFPYMEETRSPGGGKGEDLKTLRT